MIESFCFLLGFMGSTLIALISYAVLFKLIKKIDDKYDKLDTKYLQLLNILQLWQKKI
jgi:hypothetical protein